MKIEKLVFGKIVVDGVQYTEDIVVCRDYVFERPKHISSPKKAKYGHTPLTKEELEYILKNCSNIDTIVIGTGIYGALPIEHDVIKLLKSLGVEYHITPSPRAVELINEFVEKGRRVLGLIHITC